MSFPPLHLIVEEKHSTLLVAGLVHETMPTDENIHKTAIDKAFEIVALHGKDLPLTIIDHGKEYSMILTKNGETIDTTLSNNPKKQTKKHLIPVLIGTIIITASALTGAYILYTTPQANPHTPVKQVTQAKQVKPATTATQPQLLKSPTARFKPPTAKETEQPKKETPKQTEEEKPKEQPPEKEQQPPQPQAQPAPPTPTPAPPQPPAPRPTPPPQPAPPAPTNFITDMSTEASSFAGTVTFNVRLTGGNAPVTASIAGRTITFNGSGTISGIPSGTYIWTTSADGLSNSGTITIP